MTISKEKISENKRNNTSSIDYNNNHISDTRSSNNKCSI